MTEARFTALWDRCGTGGGGAAAAQIYKELVRRYSEPHRRYHTRAHIECCLRQHDLAAGLMDDADAVEMGLWFHDVIYDPRAADNERQSAKLFETLSVDHLSAAFRKAVHELILVTIHPEQPTSRDQQFMVDIDLSSFGLPWEAFRRDSDAVRQEYAHLSDADFFRNQIGFLRSLIDRPTFFFTDFFRTRYETTAIQNITRHIGELRARGFG
jgi:predicted metal-dependent HD superfamily phosphohydrolase